jgi:hypothetical protein
LILSLFSAHIYEREDFEKPKQHVWLKGHLEQADCWVNLSLRQEHNLFTLAVVGKDNNKNEAVTYYELCGQEDCRGYYRIYRKIADSEHEVRVIDKEDLPRSCTAGQSVKFANKKRKKGLTEQRYKVRNHDL